MWLLTPIAEDIVTVEEFFCFCKFFIIKSFTYSMSFTNKLSKNKPGPNLS